MKTLKTFIAGLLALACVSIAQAQQSVRLTGSTAFRANTLTAITHVYDAGFTYGYTGASFTGSSQAIFFGTIGGQPTTIKTTWSGSEGGMQTVAGSVVISFLPKGTATSLGRTQSPKWARTVSCWVDSSSSMMLPLWR